jgi:hypothetical protein
MAFSYLECTIDISDSGIIDVVDRATRSPQQPSIDLSQGNALLEVDAGSFSIGSTIEGDEGGVHHSTPVVGNDVHIDTSGELCNANACGNVNGKDVIIKIGEQHADCSRQECSNLI